MSLLLNDIETCAFSTSTFQWSLNFEKKSSSVRQGNSPGPRYFIRKPKVKRSRKPCANKRWRLTPMAGTPSAHQIPSGSHNPISFNPLTARSLYSHHPTADRKWPMGARLLLRKLVLFLARHASTHFDIWPFNPCLLSRPFPRSRDGWRTGPAKSSMEYLGFAEIVRTAVAKKLAKSDLPSPPKEIVFQRQTYPENKTVKIGGTL